jgi:hypothetical protein
LVSSAALIGVFLAAFSFWPLWIGHFAVTGVLLVLWVSWLLWLIGVYRDLDIDSPGRVWVISLIGFWTGLGFYTYLSWPLVAIWSLGMVYWTVPSGRQNLRVIGTFIFFLCLPAIPLVLEVTRMGLPQPFHRLWGGSSLVVNILGVGGYLKALGVGFQAREFNFGTRWGGLMNPLTGAAFLLGILVTAKRCFRDRYAMGFLAAAPLLLLSGGLTNSLEVMRIAHFVPWTIFLGAVGFWEIHNAFSKRMGMVVLVVLLTLSIGLDLRGAFKGAGWEDDRQGVGPSMHQSAERQEAYRILKERSRKEGSGIIFLDFIMDPTNQTLPLATQPFNALRGAGKGISGSGWVAVFTDVHDAAAVAHRFQGSEFYALSREGDYPDGGFGLVLFPVTDERQELLYRWAKAEKSLGVVVRDALERGVTSDQTKILAELDRSSILFRNDPELEAWWARIRMARECAAGDYEAGLRTLEGVGGSARADIENDKGRILFFLGRKKEAMASFKRALDCHPNFTNAKDNIMKLEGELDTPR